MLKVHDKKLGAIAVLCLQGRIVRGETATLDSAVASQSDVSTVVLDLTHVSTVDAGGLGMLVLLREQTHSRGVDLKLMNVSTLVSRVLEISRLNSVFEITSESEFLSLTSVCRTSLSPKLGLCAS